MVARGTGYCDYYDVESARSAVRNLKNREVRGRSLKVDYADPENSAPDLEGSFEVLSSFPFGWSLFPAKTFPPHIQPKMGPGGPQAAMFLPQMGGGVPFPQAGGPPPQIFPNFPGGGPFLGPAPPGMGPLTLEQATAAVAKTLQSMTTSELYDLMGQVKFLIQTNPEQAKEILSVNPQLCYALMQMLLVLNLYHYEEVQV